MGPRVADGQGDQAGDRSGVVDRVVAILDALEPGPAARSSLVAATGLPRATAHRLAVALGRHGLVSRDDEGRFVLGLRLIALGQAAADARPLRMLARQALEELRDQTGESVQLYVVEPANGSQERRCILSLQSPHGLRWIVPEGALLPLDRGSAGHVLAEAGAVGPWVASVEEREPGVASGSAPVRAPGGAVLAAVSVSGPVERLSRRPGERFGPAVVAAARAVEAQLSESG
jgi:DNA-binding IclR family transcriptional regulator